MELRAWQLVTGGILLFSLIEILHLIGSLEKVSLRHGHFLSVDCVFPRIAAIREETSSLDYMLFGFTRLCLFRLEER
jgi:hypothetical protein